MAEWPTLGALGEKTPADVIVVPPRNPARAPQGLEDAIYGMAVKPLSDIGMGIGSVIEGQGWNNPEAGAGLMAAMSLLSPMKAGALSPKLPTVYKTVNGGAVTDYKSAFDYARELAHAAGFELHGASGLSNSVYLTKPGSEKVLRIADHANVHPGRNFGDVVEVRLSPTRDEIIKTWHDPNEGMITEKDYIKAIRQSPEEITKLIKQAISEYEK